MKVFFREKEIQKWKELAEEKAKARIFDDVFDILNKKIDRVIEVLKTELKIDAQIKKPSDI